MLTREHFQAEINRCLKEYPICALLGPRQCGKSTLAKQVAKGRQAHFFDLETARGRARLANPEFALAPLTGLIVIDEIQRQPELFTVLRPLADRVRSRARFLVLGSAAPELVRGASESLAGRVGFVHLTGFLLEEAGAKRQRRLWRRGGFPRSFLARSENASLSWRHNFISTFLERDLPQLGIRIPAESLRRFWMMLAHYHAQVWNGAELARSLGVSEHTVRGYLDVLTGALVLRQLQPWFENLSKRQVKSPKVYVRDSGLLHALFDIHEDLELIGHPKFGASWEGFAVEQILATTGAEQAYFWSTHTGAELDLMLFRRGRRYGVEFRINDAPQMTKSLHVALEDLGLHHAWIVYPGEVSYPIHPKVDVVTLADALGHLQRLR